MHNNQSFIVIKKDEENLFSYENMIKILKMKGSALKLYLYFCTYMNGQKIEFSPSLIQQEIEIAKNSARNALSELISLGYVKKINEDTYIFQSVQNLV